MVENHNHDVEPEEPQESEESQQPEHKRKIDPNDITLSEGYKIEVFTEGLTTPINLIYSNNGELLVADAGITSGSGKVLKLTDNGFEVIAEGFNPPLTGITSHENGIYVAHRGSITLVDSDGNKHDIITGLPSWGDHHNNRVVFGPDNKMYFGQGTATNSGVVGEDNMSWVKDYPFFHDYPGETIVLNGRNFISDNYLTKAEDDKTYTGAYSPFSVPSYSGEVDKGIVRASGSILRANPDGSDLELVAWGLRNPFRMKFDKWNRLFTTNHGMDIRGSRPVANSPDEFYQVMLGAWYGWPDFSGGLPVTSPRFKPEGERQPEFLLRYHPMTPPRPITVFAPHSAIMGFDFNYSNTFGRIGDVYMAEFGSEAPRTTGGRPLPEVGHRVSRIDINTGRKYIFAINKSSGSASHNGEGGFERPIDVLFGKDEEMFIVDFGMQSEDGHHGYLPNTGVIWRVTKE